MSKKKNNASEAPESPQNASDNKVTINTPIGPAEVSMDDLYHNYAGVKSRHVLEWEKEYKKTYQETERMIQEVENIVAQEIEDMGIDSNSADLSRGIELVENVMSVLGDTDKVSAEEWAGYIMMGFKHNYEEIKATRLSKKIYPGIKESKNGTLWIKKDEK